MPDAEPLPHLLTIDQLAEHLGVTQRHIRRLVAERRIPFLKVGRFVRFDPSDVGTWLDVTRRRARSSGGLSLQ
jgi:excisionase family DNA binding protein